MAPRVKTGLAFARNTTWAKSAEPRIAKWFTIIAIADLRRRQEGALAAGNTGASTARTPIEFPSKARPDPPPSTLLDRDIARRWRMDPRTVPGQRVKWLL